MDMKQVSFNFTLFRTLFWVGLNDSLENRFHLSQFGQPIILDVKHTVITTVDIGLHIIKNDHICDL